MLGRPGTRVLIFNQQGHNRVALPLLEGLYSAITSDKLVKFDHVIFCTSTGQRKGTSLLHEILSECSDVNYHNVLRELQRDHRQYRGFKSKPPEHLR